MTADWTPISVLPNVSLEVAVECDIAALAPTKDPRVGAVKRAHPMFRRFLNRFSDNFGQKFEPTVLMVRADAPPSFLTVSALASFRDLIAVSTVAYGRALHIRRRLGHRVMFGDAFAIYPWMLDRHFEDLIGNTPAILGTHDVAKFKGQASPTLFRGPPLDAGDLDQPLLAALLMRWRQLHEAAAPCWSDIALFRSLNMAYHASLLPAGTDTTFLDVGRIVSLWVSAFEILVHPGGNGQANRDRVFELIESVAWELPSSSDRTHDTGGKAKVKRTLASWLYQVLHDCRNDFLHGNPVQHADLLLPNSERTIFDYAAPLYRLALTAYLPLVHGKMKSTTANTDALAAHLAEQMAFVAPQRRVEEALHTAVKG